VRNRAIIEKENGSDFEFQKFIQKGKNKSLENKS
jgi:hypothetical protein